MKKLSSAALIAAAVLTLSTTAHAARDNISIVGSSTVYPFSTAVAEKFGKTTTFKTPTIESTGSGGGAKLFCGGVGAGHPDITNSSRRIKSSEFETCTANGVKVVEILVGFDGIVVANAKTSSQLSLTRKDLFLALAKDVPNPNGSENFVANPYKTWKQVNASLPDVEIEVLGPPPTSGTRDAFAELVMEGGCKEYPFIKAMKKTDKSAYKAVCHTVREDGAYVESGENDNLIVQKLQKNPDALGIFGFSFLEENASKVQGSFIEGISPTFDTIADKSYPVSRPLYFYVKKNHVGVIPGIEEYIAEFTQESTWNKDGYLAERGMIPLSDSLRKKYSTNAKSLVEMTSSDFK
jgi:phosphate transport system substrate-binding protein